MNNNDDPETIFDLNPNELDLLINFRKLTPEQQNQLFDYIKRHKNEEDKQ